MYSDVHKTLQDRLKDQLASIGLPGLEKDAAQIVLSIHDIVNKRYKDQLAISEYRMESLQAQIKPHFLYNTLDALKWMIMDEQTEDAVWRKPRQSDYRMHRSSQAAVMVWRMSEKGWSCLKRKKENLWWNPGSEQGPVSR